MEEVLSLGIYSLEGQAGEGELAGLGRHLEELSCSKWVGVRAGKEAVRT